MDAIRNFLREAGLPAADADAAPDSALRFPDGGEYRIEIPSTEGPRVLSAVLEEAEKRAVPVHRISQGSGIMLLTDDEIREMAAIGAKHSIEVNLFLGPRASFDIGAQAVSATGRAFALLMRGANQIVHGLADVERAVELGIRSVLVSDIGSLEMVAELRAKGVFPSNLIVKTSVMMAPANPVSARLLERLGADTINIPSDLTLSQIASIRAAITKPIDFYVEAPDNIGGFIRYYEIADLIRVAAPVYLKFGLRNAPDVYPSGTHLENNVLALSRERVRRAQIAFEMINRYCPLAKMSPLGAADLGIPVPADH
jgi:hypothetical protein